MLNLWNQTPQLSGIGSESSSSLSTKTSRIKLFYLKTFLFRDIKNDKLCFCNKKFKIGNFGNCCFWLQKSVKLKEEFIRITDLGFRFAWKLNGSLVLILINHGHTTLGKPIFLFRDELEKRGLSKAGKKDELIQRLESYLEVSITRVYI